MQRFCKVDDEVTCYVSNKYGFSLRFCIFAFAKNIYVIGMEALVKTKKEGFLLRILLSVAVRTGLEPVTPCVTGMYSNQLN